MEYEDFYINKFLNDMLFCAKHVERNPREIKSILDQYCNLSYILSYDIKDKLTMASDICLDSPRKAKNICLTLIDSFRDYKIKSDEVHGKDGK
jgi:hypothetical protein